MLMVKEEIRNTIRFTKIRFRVAKRSFIYLLVSYLFVMVSSTILNIVKMFQYAEVPEVFFLNDSSRMILVGGISGFFIMQFLYRNINRSFEVYPQTNNSRYISSLLGSCCYMGLCTLVIAAGSLLRLGFFKIFALFHSNFVFAFQFDIDFFITGLFVYLMYGLLVVSMGYFIGSIIRRFHIYAIVSLAAFAVVVLVRLGTFVQFVRKIQALFVSEKSRFFAISVSLFICLTVLSVMLNRFTVYYRRNIWSKPSTIIIAGLLAVSVMILSMFCANYVESKEMTDVDGIPDIHYAEERISDYEALYDIRTFDISGLEKNSQVKVHVNENMNNGSIEGMSLENFKMHVLGSDTLPVSGSILRINYEFPYITQNGVNIIDFIHYDFQARLQGNELFLSCQYTKNIKIIALSMWESVRFFNCYKDKNLTCGTFGTSYSKRGGIVEIEME